MTTTNRELATLSDPMPIARQLWGDERIALLKEQLGRGWKRPMTDAELEHIGAVCQRNRLDPLAVPKQIHCIQRLDRAADAYVMTIQTSIDGLRLIASRSRDYGGATPYLYTADGVTWTEAWLSDDPPAAAKVGVRRKGSNEWFWAVATWREWKQEEAVWEGPAGNRRKVGTKLAPFWEKMPAHMLGKTAEGIALKRAFPEETNELELARVDEEWREQQVINAQRYRDIFGTEDELIDPIGAAASRTALNAAGHTVDVSTGEVLEEGGQNPTENNNQNRETPGPAQASPTSAPDRSVLWQENRRLVTKAMELGLQGIVTLSGRSTADALAEANGVLLERIRRHEAEIPF